MTTTTVTPPAHYTPPRRPLVSKLTVATAVGLVLVVGVYWHGKSTTDTQHQHYVASQAALHTTQANLAATKATVVNLNAKVDSLTSQLATAQSSLQSSQADAASSHALTQDLKTCLDGVINAENDTLDGDYVAASNDLSGVQGVCQSALHAVDGVNASA